MNVQESTENHINHFRLRTHRKARAHYLASKSLSRRHIWLGVPIILISTFVGSGVVADLSKSVTFFTPIILGLLSLTAAVLSSFQTFFSFSKLSEKHKNAASQYNALYRKLTLLRTKYLSDEYPRKEILTQLDDIQKNWEVVENEAADVPDKLYDQAKKEQTLDEEGV